MEHTPLPSNLKEAISWGKAEPKPQVEMTSAALPLAVPVVKFGTIFWAVFLGMWAFSLSAAVVYAISRM